MLTIFFASLGFATPAQNTAINVFLALGLFSIGIPHGAVDHLLESGVWDNKYGIRFIITYIFKAAIMAAVWLFYPVPALVIFIMFSAFHFGEADGKQWGLGKLESLTWGVYFISFMLCSHHQETTAIIKEMGITYACPSLPFYSLLPCVVWAAVKRSTTLALTTLWLTLAVTLPLTAVFGLYFIGQHSFTSWQHICAKLQSSSRVVWMNALPFNLTAWIFFVLYLWLWPHLQFTSQSLTGAFFIFIACISFPHVIEMHGMYKRIN